MTMQYQFDLFEEEPSETALLLEEATTLRHKLDKYRMSFFKRHKETEKRLDEIEKRLELIESRVFE